MRPVMIAVAGIMIGSLAGSACSRTETPAAAAAATSPAASPATSAPTASAASNPEPGAPASAAADPRPTSSIREVTLPAGTQLPIVLDTTVGSDISTVEEPVSAHLARPITVRGERVLSAGSLVKGVVTDAQRSGKVKGLAHIAVRFESLTPSGDDERYRIRTTAVGRTAQATKKKDALEIGGGAAGGALIGALIGGKKGAAIGTAAGGGAGTAVVLSTRGKEVHLNRGAALTLRLTEPVTLKLRG